MRYQYGGLFCSRDDGPLLRLILSFPGKAHASQDDAGTFTYLAHLYNVTSNDQDSPSSTANNNNNNNSSNNNDGAGSSNRTSLTSYRRIYLEECPRFLRKLIPQYSTFPPTAVTARAVSDLSRNIIVLKVPHLCVPWGRKLGECLWKKLNIRLERWGGSRRWEGVGNGHRLTIGSDMWPEAKGEAREYNAIVIAYLEKRHGKGILAKVANLIRLEYANELKTDIHRNLIRISDEIFCTRAEIKDNGYWKRRRKEEDDTEEQKDRDRLSVEPSSSPSAPTSSTPSPESGMANSPSSLSLSSLSVGGVRERNEDAAAAAAKIMTAAVAVPRSSRYGSTLKPENFLINGTVVSIDELPGFCAYLKTNYSIVVERNENGNNKISGLQQEIADYLKEFGTDWRSVVEAAKANAKRSQVLQKIRSLEMRKEKLLELEDQVMKTRGFFIEKAVRFDSMGASLTRICALRVAKMKAASGGSVMDYYGRASRLVWKTVDAAAQRLGELERAEPVDNNSFAVL